MNIPIQFIGGAYTARSTNLNAQVCQNFYVETDTTGAKSPIALIGCPGLVQYSTVGKNVEIRAMHEFQGFPYVVAKDEVYRINADQTVTMVGYVETSEGWCDIVDDGLYMAVFDALGLHLWDGATWSTVNLPVAPSGATYQDGYYIISRADTDQFFVSDSDDPTSWDASNYATAEGSGDLMIAPVSVSRQLWLIGSHTSECWYNAGTSGGVPFERNPGGYIATGCNARRSIVTYNDELMFLDDKNRIVRKQGLQLIPVSTYQIDYLISTMTTISDAIGFMYQQEGHQFYELTFPTDSRTICYDLSTGFWHTRASGADDLRSRGNCAIRFNNKVLIGDYENGKIGEYSLSTYDDYSETKRAIRHSQFINNNQQLTFFNSFQIDMEAGVGTNDITDPQGMLQWSDNGGKTWSSEKWKSLGAIGQYTRRVKWNRLGKAWDRIWRYVISDAVPRNIVGAYIDGTVGNA